MLIDFHTHAFPRRIAEGAMKKLSFASGGLKPQTDGTIESLETEMKKDGVDISVVQSIATNPDQQTNVNNFAIELNSREHIFAFGSVHPDSKDVMEELTRIKDAGLKGVKFHPEYQGFYVNDAKMKPIYKKISSLGLITLFHAGHDFGFSAPYHCMPSEAEAALSWFDSPVVLAHWGGLGASQDVLKHLCGKDVWFDLSFGYAAMPREFAVSIVEKHTPDRLLFGSDMPWHRPSWEFRLLDTLPLTAEDRQKILSGNAQKLLNITQP